jgi:hypothetical protein
MWFRCIGLEGVMFAMSVKDLEKSCGCDLPLR